MINLITGLPGACKTLYTLTMVDAMAKRDNRPVFYSGITDVKLPNWTEFDAEKWYECPPGALIVIDECQRIFRPRTISKEVPLFVSELETHRHKGLDLFLVTQHPLLADSALRRLAGKHTHCVRSFGLQGAMLHEWQSVKDNCDKPAGRADSMKTRWPYNKAMFGMYKSAEIHTVKRHIPTKVKILLATPFIIGGLAFMFYRSVDKKMHPVAPPGAAAMVQGGMGMGGGGGSSHVSYKDAKNDAQQYAFEHTPRVDGWGASAPRYDEITKPVTVALPVACVTSKEKGCKCFSQQATPVNVTNATCIAIVENGFFQDFDDGSEHVRKPGAVDLRQAGPQGNDLRASDGLKVASADSSALGSPPPSRRSPEALGGSNADAGQVTQGVRHAPPKGALGSDSPGMPPVK